MTADPPIPEVREVTLAYDPTTGALDADYNTTFNNDTYTEAAIWACVPGGSWAPRTLAVPSLSECGTTLRVLTDPPGTQYIVHVKWHDVFGGHVTDFAQLTKP